MNEIVTAVQSIFSNKNFNQDIFLKIVQDFNWSTYFYSHLRRSAGDHHFNGRQKNFEYLINILRQIKFQINRRVTKETMKTIKTKIPFEKAAK